MDDENVLECFFMVNLNKMEHSQSKLREKLRKLSGFDRKCSQGHNSADLTTELPYKGRMHLSASPARTDHKSTKKIGN